MGYENVTDTERRLFTRAHQKHLSSLTSKEREQYGLGNVVEVKPNLQQAAIDKIQTPLKHNKHCADFNIKK